MRSCAFGGKVVCGGRGGGVVGGGRSVIDRFASGALIL